MSKIVEEYPPFKGVKQVNYHEYLQSNDWQTMREIALHRADYRCQLCNKEDELHVHHRTYKGLGNEDPRDLTVLCKRCHFKHHQPERDALRIEIYKVSIVIDELWDKAQGLIHGARTEEAKVLAQKTTREQINQLVNKRDVLLERLEAVERYY